MLLTEKATILTNTFRIRKDLNIEFADWQAKYNAAIAAFPGFVSLEILSPDEQSKLDWTIVQRFSDAEKMKDWRQSREHSDLIKELERFLVPPAENSPEEVETNMSKGCVTEVFVTKVSRDKEEAYRTWIAKIHQVEAKFPGFRGVYVQSPSKNQAGNWITLLQFDTPENLDRWLSSPERREVLNESQSLIESLDTHRVISPYAGWFSSLAKKGPLPPVWKQTMIVLLVLFPIIMLELKFLSPFTDGLNRALGTFIGNALSVVLIAWPFTPVAIWFLGWWLSPSGENKTRLTIYGTLLVIGLYALEIAIFWYLL